MEKEQIQQIVLETLAQVKKITKSQKKIKQTTQPDKISEEQIKSVTQRGRQCKYQSKEEAIEVAKQQRKVLAIKYAQQKQNFRNQAASSQLYLIKRLSTIIITDPAQLEVMHNILNLFEKPLENLSITEEKQD